MNNRMHSSDELGMENNSTSQKSHGVQQLVHRVSSSGMVLKFKVDKYGTLPSKSTIPSREVRSSVTENARDSLDKFEANCAQNVIPLFEQSEISKMKTRDELPPSENAKVSHPDQGINKAVTVDNSTMVVEKIASLKSIVEKCALKINENNFSENAKMDDMENVITGKCSLEDLEGRAAENESGYGSEAHLCDQCGKGFKEITSLHGHMGTHRREEYKSIRMMLNQQNPVVDDASRRRALRKFKRFLEPARALVQMSVAPVWDPEHGTATIDLSASVTCPSDDEMMEAAMCFTTFVKRIRKEAEKAPLPSSGKNFGCKICNKAFSSYHALGGHMSIHNNPKRSLLENGGGSSSGSSEECTWNFVCGKCNKKFPTGKSLSGHKRKHHYEEKKMKLIGDMNEKEPMLPPHGTMQPSGRVVLPNHLNMQPSKMERMVANASVHQLPPPAFDAVRQPMQASSLGKETKKPSGVPNILVGTTAYLPAPGQIPPYERSVFDLNILPE